MCVPVDDVKVVPVVPLTDDVVTAVDRFLEHGVQDVLHLILCVYNIKQQENENVYLNMQSRNLHISVGNRGHEINWIMSLITEFHPALSNM